MIRSIMQNHYGGICLLNKKSFSLFGHTFLIPIQNFRLKIYSDYTTFKLAFSRNVPFFPLNFPLKPASQYNSQID